MTKKKTKSNEPEPTGHDFAWAINQLWVGGYTVARLSWPARKRVGLRGSDDTGDEAWIRGEPPGGDNLWRPTRVEMDAKDWVLADDLRRQKKLEPVVRLLPSEISDCRDCFAFRASPSHNLACAHARLYNNATERQQYIVPQRDASGSYKPLDDCPLKKQDTLDVFHNGKNVAKDALTLLKTREEK